jgi:hypothetical protein
VSTFPRFQVSKFPSFDVSNFEVLTHKSVSLYQSDVFIFQSIWCVLDIQYVCMLLVGSFLLVTAESSD